MQVASSDSTPTAASNTASKSHKGCPEPPAVSSFTLHLIDNQLVHGTVVSLPRARYIWLGEASNVADHLATALPAFSRPGPVAEPTPYAAQPAVASTLRASGGGVSDALASADDFALALARRLTQRAGVPVFLSVNLPALVGGEGETDLALAAALERALAAQLAK